MPHFAMTRGWVQVKYNDIYKKYNKNLDGFHKFI